MALGFSEHLKSKHNVIGLSLVPANHPLVLSAIRIFTEDPDHVVDTLETHVKRGFKCVDLRVCEGEGGSTHTVIIDI